MLDLCVGNLEIRIIKVLLVICSLGLFQYLGCIEVFESRGIQICEEAINLLKNVCNFYLFISVHGIGRPSDNISLTLTDMFGVEVLRKKNVANLEIV